MRIARDVDDGRRCGRYRSGGRGEHSDAAVERYSRYRTSQKPHHIWQCSHSLSPHSGQNNWFLSKNVFPIGCFTSCLNVLFNCLQTTVPVYHGR